MQFENPAVQTYRRLRRNFPPEQYSREHLLETILVGSWSGPWRLMTRNYEKPWKFAIGICFHSNSSVNVWGCEWLNAYVVEPRLSNKTPMESFTNLVCFAKMVAGNYMSDFVGFCIVCQIQPCSLKTPPPWHKWDYGAFIAGTIPQGKFIRKSSSGAMIGPMSVDDEELWKIMKCCIWQ